MAAITKTVSAKRPVDGVTEKNPGVGGKLTVTVNDEKPVEPVDVILTNLKVYVPPGDKLFAGNTRVIDVMTPFAEDCAEVSPFSNEAFPLRYHFDITGNVELTVPTIVNFFDAKTKSWSEYTLTSGALSFPIDTYVEAEELSFPEVTITVAK